mgnify:CR=1 FL=1
MRKILKEFERLKKESNYKYFVVGSPTHGNWVKVVEGDTLKEIWEQLVKLGEIDMENYEKDNEVFDEKTEKYQIPEPSNYKYAIENYISGSNNFFYRKLSWLE